MKLLLLYICFAVVLIGKLEAAKILVIHTTVTKSHLIPLQVLAVSLAVERNHDVTFMSAYPIRKNITNLREFPTFYNEEDKQYIFKLSETKNSGPFWNTLKHVSEIAARIGNSTLQSPALRKLMDTEKFDLIILGYYMNEYMLGLGDHFNCPTVIFSPSNMMSTLHIISGNPFEIAASNHYLLQGERHDFRGRMKNFIMQSFDFLVIRNYFYYYGKKVYKFNFPSSKYRSYSESLRNVSLILLNSHFSIGSLRPLLPNVVEVGGLQVGTETSLLPDDIKNFLNNAKDGAIYFSLGSKVDVDVLPEKSIETIFRVFSRLKQKVIMKWGTKELQNKPKNVYVGKWLPQNDILAHPNVKLFISHCGINGIVEAKDHAVPILANPLYSDQFGNAKRIQNEGWGKVIDLRSITEDDLMKDIQEMLTNSSYKLNAERLSRIQSDRPMDAKSLAIYWIEYVIKYHGAPHLHYPAADMNFFQRNSLDVIGVLLAVSFVIIWVTLKIFKTIWNLKLPRIKIKKS